MTRASAQHEEATTFEELNLVDYWLLIRKHIKGILGLSVAVALLATLIVYQVTPVYRSTSLLLIENSKSKALTLTDLFDLQNNAGQDALNSQIQILKSRAIAERVIRKLELYKSTIFNPPETTGWFVSGADLESVVSDDTLIKNLVGRFSKSLTIEPLPKSQIVKISFESSNRFLAAQVANAVADTYIENDLEARSQMTQRAKLWLTQRMEDLRNNLENSEKALQQYREKENIIDNKGVVLGGTAKQMDEISSNLIAAKQRMSEAQIVYNQVGANRGGSVEGLDSVPAITKSAAVQRAKETESNAARKLSELQSRYTAAHPKVIAAQTELHLAHEAVKREVQATVNGITKEYEIAKESVAASSRALDQIKADIQSLTRREFKLGVLMRDAESNKQLYD
ncbi:MAG: GumC family protein, partial [Gallionella sp.]